MAQLEWPGRVGGTATPPPTTASAQAALILSTSSPRATLSDDGDQGPGPDSTGSWGGGDWGAETAKRGAGRAGRGGPGTSPREEVPAPRFGEVRPRRLRIAPCAPSPTIRPDFGARGPGGGGASGSRARPVSARARRRGRWPCPCGPRARGPCGAGTLGSRLRDPHPQGLPTRGPRGPWAAAGREPVPPPRARGEGALQPGSPFLQLKAWGSDCSKGGPEEPRFPRLPPPSGWWGGTEAGHPVRPRPVGSGSL